MPAPSGSTVGSVLAPVTARYVKDCVDGCTQSHRALLAAVQQMRGASFAAPSRLPGWSRAHVVGHLALNARSHVRLLESAARGEQGEQYPGGAAARAAAIESSADTPPPALIDELDAAVEALESAWADATPPTWEGTGRQASGAVIKMSDLPFLRWREVLVHLTDLDVGVESDAWPSLYLRLELERGKMAWAAARPMGLTLLPDRANELPVHQRVEWLVGRRQVDGLPAGPGL